MLKKHLSGLLVLVLVFTFGRISAHALTGADLENEPRISGTSGEYDILAEPEVQPNAKLRADMKKLLAEAKAGNVTPRAKPQIQPAKSNNLSKTTKIAIGLGIAIVVLALVIKHQKDHFFDCKSRCVI